VACDFFTIETVFLKTFYVLVFMHIRSRRILGVGVSANPDGGWVTQQARNLVMDLDDDSQCETWAASTCLPWRSGPAHTRSRVDAFTKT
jgi:hypothetical protein